MNAKNIILAILMVLSFTACTSEIDGIDNDTPVATTNDASINVRMMLDEMTTKSNPVNDGTEISNYIIAVFEKATGARVGYKTGTHFTNQTVSDLQCKEGDLKVIVVANAPESKFANIYDLDEFTNQTVGNLNDLVKVGSAEVNLSSTNKEVSVTLYQLTARVQVKMNVNIDGNPENVSAVFTASNYTATVVNSSKIFNPEVANGVSSTVEFTGEPVSEFTYYTYKNGKPSLSINANLVVTANGQVKTFPQALEVPFKKDGELLDTLLNGESYTLNIEATISVSVDCEVQLSYKIHGIETIKNDITFE